MKWIGGTWLVLGLMVAVAVAYRVMLDVASFFQRQEMNGGVI